MDMRAPKVVSSVVVALALLTSCGDHSERPAAIRASDGSSTAENPPPTRPSRAPDEFGTDLQTHEQSGPYDLVLTDVSVQDHHGHDRVVLRFAGTGRPGWAARFVDRAVLEGSGDVVELEGDALLRLDISGTPTRASSSSAPVRSELDGDVVDVHTVGAYEGITQVFVGLRDRPTAFRVAALAAPSRLVVDLE